MPLNVFDEANLYTLTFLHDPLPTKNIFQLRNLVCPISDMLLIFLVLSPPISNTTTTPLVDELYLSWNFLNFPWLLPIMKSTFQ